jgi:hypothetical protein
MKSSETHFEDLGSMMSLNNEFNMRRDLKKKLFLATVESIPLYGPDT